MFPVNKSPCLVPGSPVSLFNCVMGNFAGFPEMMNVSGNFDLPFSAQFSEICDLVGDRWGVLDHTIWERGLVNVSWDKPLLQPHSWERLATIVPFQCFKKLHGIFSFSKHSCCSNYFKKKKNLWFYSKLTFIANRFVLRFLRFCCCYCGSLLKSSLNFLQYHFWFMFLVFWPRGMSGILAPWPAPLHWKVKSQPLDHQGSPCLVLF